MSTAKEILVPVDGSQNALRAVRYALGLAGALGARIRLFYVFPVSSVEIIGMAGMSRDDIEHAANRLLLWATAAVCGVCSCYEGIPRTCICECSRRVCHPRLRASSRSHVRTFARSQVSRSLFSSATR